MDTFTGADVWVRCGLALSAMYGMFAYVIRRSRRLMAVRTAVAGTALMVAVSAVPSRAEDLTKYRDIQFGSTLDTVARRTGVPASQARVLQSRPEHVQELEWRPQPLGPSEKSEAVRSVMFTFLNGELFRMVIEYDRYKTEGLTPEDLIQAMSASYGTPMRPGSAGAAAPGRYADREELLARWSNDQNSFELIRSSWGPSYKLTGVSKVLDGKATASFAEAARMDAIEAPSREAAAAAKEVELERSRLEQTRSVNRPKFKP